MTKAIMLHEKDNVATCMNGAKKGDLVQCVGGTNVKVTCLQDIPNCHKIALVDFAKGTKVVKYGEVIGEAMENISKGYLVSHFNIKGIPRAYDTELI